MEKEINNITLVVLIIGLTFLVAATMALFLSEFRGSVNQPGTSEYFNFIYIEPETLDSSGEIYSVSVNTPNNSYVYVDAVTNPNNYINTNNNFSEIFNSSFSISFWLNISNSSYLDRYLFGSQSLSDYSSYFIGYIDSNGALEINYGTSNVGQVTYVRYNSFFDTDKEWSDWKHLVINVFQDGNYANMSVYLDGTLQNISYGEYYTLDMGDYSSTYDFYLGNNNPLGLGGVKAYFDDFRIYKKSLSLIEINALYEDRK